MKAATLPFAFPLDRQQILRNRARILAALLASDDAFCRIPCSGMRKETPQRMLALYDDVFLGGFLAHAYRGLTVTLSSRLTSAAGKFIYSQSPVLRMRQAEIRMSSDFLTRLTDGPFELNGLSVATAQEAFLVVFEHELCHALETALYGQTGHSERFRQLAYGLFGHTATRHSLPTRKQEAAKDGFLVGSKVSFFYEGKLLSGTISYIGKTATVMVPSLFGSYRDRMGRRYDKYRVQLSELKKSIR